MALERKRKLSLVVPLDGKLNILRIRNQLINSKYALIEIIALEKSQFTFASPLCLPTNHQVIYGFEFSIFGQLFQVNGRIELESNNDNEYTYKAVIKSEEHVDSEMLYAINQLAVTQNTEYVKLSKSYTPEPSSALNTVDLIC
ncbi:hypothetical protein HQN89_05580 [Paenibacillus frigoriresistens]|uniref:hypothetical protein n=1 Tax=Paenibacillus alginolyticus TaxID=59839 RepID=UPI001566A07E|nr:hypothetical protein [Paenibacillus frigoriresistens]NRF90507.1 hypothetical protein [Paenibacillus frigoriresistens]